MSEYIQQEIAISGSLFSVALFQQKLLKNFLLISNKLRKLQGLFELQQKTKTTQKQLKFLTMKVQTIMQRTPKDNSSSVNKNDVKMMIKDGIFDILNSSDERLYKSKYHQDVLIEINKMKEEVNKISTKDKDGGKKQKKDGPKTSFTAGQILRQNQKSITNSPKISKESLVDVLNQQQLQIVSDIIQQKQHIQKNQFAQINQKIQNLTKIIEELRLGRGYAHFLQRQTEKFQKFEQYEQKSRNTTRKIKDKPIQLQGIKQQNVKGQLLKLDLLSEVQRMQFNKQEIAKSQLNNRKSVYSNLFPNVKQTKMIREINIKQKDSTLKDSTLNDKQGFRRTQSIKKIDRGQKRLKVDDIKDINSVLRQIQLRIQTKVSHDIFMGFVKDIEEKLEVLRLNKDSTSDINEIRKNIYVLEGKMQSVVSYLQSLSQQDEALFVKKQWTCVSCDKGLEKYQGKIGQHLNWQNISGKKISPTKIGAFGQTGQLAAKIRNLIDGGQDQQ